MAETLKGLTIDIGLGTAKLDSGLKDLNAKMKALNSEMKVNMSAFDRGEKSIEKYETQLTGLNKKLEMQATVAEKARKSYEKMVNEHGEGSKEADKAARAYNEEAAQLNNLQRYVDGVTQEMKDFKKQQEIAASGWTKFSKQLGGVGKQMKNIGSQMTDVGKKMTLGVTAPILATGGAAVKAAIDFETAFAGVRKTVDASEAEFANLEKGIRDMAKEIPASAEEISGVAEAAGQLGIQKDAILGFTRTMIDLGESTNMTADVAATELARLANIVQMPQENFDRLGSTIVALGNSMATTEGEITSMSLRIAAQAKQVNMTEDQILALAAAMSSVGIEAEAGGTAMTTVLKKMQGAVAENGADLELWAKTAGVSAAEFKTAFEDDAAAALDMVIKGLAAGAAEGGNMSDMLADLGIKGVREADTMMRLAGAGDTLADALQTANKGWSENTALTDEAAQRYKTMESQLAILKNNLRDLGYDIGEMLLPIVSDMVDFIQDGIDWFKGLSDEAKTLMVTFAGVAAAIGPVLVVGGTLVSSVGSILTAFSAVTAAVGTAGGLGAALSSFAAATGPVGLTIAALAGLGYGAYKLTKYLSGPAIEDVDLFGEELEGVSESTKKALSEFWTLSDGIDDALAEMKVNGGEFTKEIGDTIVGNFREMNETILREMDENYQERKRIMTDAFSGYRYFTDEEQKQILERMDQHHKDEQAKQQAQMDRINEIKETALKEHRDLTEQELIEIDAINTQMQEQGITQLSESAAEEAAIRQRLKDTNEQISKEEAADLIGRAAEVRDKTIEAAEKRYDDIVATATYQRDELGTLTEDQAARIIQAAKDERDNTVWEAEQKYGELYDTTVEGNADLELEIDRHTGEVRTKWEVLYRGLAIDLTKYAAQTAKTWLDLYQDIVTGAVKLPKRMGAAFSAGAAAAGKGIADIGNEMIRTFEGAVNKVIDGVNAVTERLGFGGNIKHWYAGRIIPPRSSREGNARPVVAYASGTDGHPGGPMIVGDKYGRELVEFPDGTSWLSPDTDTLVPNAPKGTRVIPNELTEKLIRGNVPFYAGGTGVTSWLKDKLSSVWDYATNPGKLVDKILDTVLSGMGLGGGAGDVAKAAVKNVGGKALDHIKSMFQKAGDFTGGNFGGNFRLTSRAGWRIHPILRTPMFHYGDDYAAPAGTPVPSQSGGIVKQAGFHGLRGNYVRVKSGVYELVYQHLKDMFVRAGQAVTKGQILGTVGSTGRSTGPHLHFETWKNGQFVPPKSFGFATGGIVRSRGMYELAEEGPEMVIPLAPERRTDAMKLLAIAGRMLGGTDEGIRPNQMQNPITGGGSLESLLAATLEQNQILMMILQKDPNLYVNGREMARELADDVDDFIKFNKRRRDSFGRN